MSCRERMPKDYFDLKVEGEDEEIPEAEKEIKVQEFVYQAGLHSEELGKGYF